MRVRPDVAAVIARLWRDERASWPEWFPRRDAELACEVDRFDFALPVTRENGLLGRVSVSRDKHRARDRSLYRRGTDARLRAML